MRRISSLEHRGAETDMDFVLPVRVYLEDTDAQGVVYNASYFRFMERARTEWLGRRGLDHGVLERVHGVRVVLARVEAEFRTPARLGDLLEVAARVRETRGSRIVFGHEIRQGPGEYAGVLVCRGVAEVACVDIDQGKPRRLPPTLVSEMSQ
jgi:acyl-CoA thioester hydrolase